MLDARGTAVPRLIHWGDDLGDVEPTMLETVAAGLPAIAPSSPDIPLVPSILAGPAEGWSGFPALVAHRIGAGPARLPMRIQRTGHVQSTEHSVSVELLVHDDYGPLVTVGWHARLSPEGVLVIALDARAEAPEGVELHRLAATVPGPARASELLDFSGLWAAERTPQRGAVRDGLHLRDQRRGRPGHDAPYLTVLGTPGFGFRSGEVWALHHAWSGNSTTGVESMPTGHRRLLASELLAPAEIVLAAGETYTAPETVLAWSSAGLDGLSDRLHPFVRALTPPTHRPVVLNTWEAVYFDHALESLMPLVDAAAELGIERFVLDDGWFTGRTDDRRALGDWTVDPERWPAGLHPLVDAVVERGMEFGLWVEPEMVSPDSRLAREHPEWMLADAATDTQHPPTWRFQHTLDLTIDEARAHLLESLSALLAEYPIAFLKWDHNRDQHAGSAAAHTRAVYALIDDLRARFPHVAIESCASGGARVDLGMAARVHRFWTSDTNDALDRQRIQRYSGLLMPPELLGGHVGAPRAHITGRTHDLSFRLATALFGSAGIEWNVTTADAAQLDALREWVATVKLVRPLLTTGRTVRTDEATDDRYVHGLVSPDGSEALIALVTLATAAVAVPPPLRFPGLDPGRRYRIEPLTVGGPPHAIQDAPPAWLADGGITITGRLLAELGLPVPLLAPEQALLLRAVAVD
ncbi:alpha-galactosidase [Microcella sp.]|uniref:alpha-galactosidase n=1 Tax=Microcella sp. TaxID=1913979 RepID=UPI00299F6A5A|nr:alpha-galactosidase [Microcella sp.]MDX2025155.1 alpha-galactosidase [Microcella sp.]